jgi:hypothetical protein
VIDDDEFAPRDRRVGVESATQAVAAALTLVPDAGWLGVLAAGAAPYAVAC